MRNFIIRYNLRMTCILTHHAALIMFSLILKFPIHLAPPSSFDDGFLNLAGLDAQHKPLCAKVTGHRGSSNIELRFYDVVSVLIQ